MGKYNSTESYMNAFMPFSYFTADSTFSSMSISKNVTQPHIPQVQCSFNILQERRQGEKDSHKIISEKALKAYLFPSHISSSRESLLLISANYKPGDTSYW